jgi:hypothetical protein
LEVEQFSVAIATINRVILWFNEAFQGLAVDVPMAEVERLALLVHHSLDGKTRTFHTTEHIFDMCEGMNPVQILAALFHDVVYCQLDGGIARRVAPLLADVTRTEHGVLLLQNIRPGDTTTALCADLFGYEPGQALLPHNGMNEFLSAIVAARLLQRHLSAEQLIAVLACIEATIFFRVPDANGRTAADKLALRVQRQGAKLQAGHSLSVPDLSAFVKTVVTDAVVLANRDVAGITEADPGLCLSNTLLLIEESNVPLMATGVYSVQEYRGALLRMSGFLSNLSPAFIFQHYDGYPDAGTRLIRGETAARNVKFSCDYLDVMLASVAIIEALALSTGSDAPIAMFLGETTRVPGRLEPAADFRPVPPSGPHCDTGLLGVLEMGCAPGSRNNRGASSLAAFVYRSMGRDGIRLALQQAEQLFEGNLSPRAFLLALDCGVVRAIIRACEKNAVSRSAALLALESSLYASDDRPQG